MARQTRREFLRTVARTAGLFGLGAIAWSSISRSGRSGPAGATPRFPCERCPALTSCSQAESLQARDALGPRARTENAMPGVPPRRLCIENGLVKLPPQDRG